MNVNDDEHITLAEFARRRGVSYTTAYRWKQQERLVLTHEGKVAFTASLQRLEGTRKLSHAYQNSRRDGTQKTPAIDFFADDDPVDFFADSDIEEFTGKDDNYNELVRWVEKTTVPTQSGNWEALLNHSKAMKERSLALKAAAEYEQTIGKLVLKELVEQAVFERHRAFRDALAAMGARLSPEFAANNDAVAIQKTIDREIRDILQQFAVMPLIMEDNKTWAARINLEDNKDNG